MGDVLGSVDFAALSDWTATGAGAWGPFDGDGTRTRSSRPIVFREAPLPGGCSELVRMVPPPARSRRSLACLTGANTPST